MVSKINSSFFKEICIFHGGVGGGSTFFFAPGPKYPKISVRGLKSTFWSHAPDKLTDLQKAWFSARSQKYFFDHGPTVLSFFQP